MPATNRKSEDRQLANALRAKGFKTPLEFLHDVWVEAVQKYPKFPETSCNAAIKKLRDEGGLPVQAILDGLIGNRIMEFARPYDRAIRDELEARIRKGKAPVPSPGTKQNANGAGPFHGASAGGRTASAGPVRGSAAISLERRKAAVARHGAMVRRSLYDTTIIEGKPLGDWTRDEVFSTIRPRCALLKFALMVAEQTVTSGPLRTGKISEEALADMLLEAKASVGG